MKQTLAIIRKELNGYFSSPMALLFIGVFLATTLFTFFWADAFFARGVADVRPMFRWMPILLIFLTAALTMRQWSEEQHSGTLEILLTLPTRPRQLVFGKFFAVVMLVEIALALTFFLPLTVALLGNLDWGPVLGGYLAAVLLAAAYAALGLFISSRTDNQLVSLILTVLLGGFLYLVGSSAFTGLFGDTIAEILRAIGSGSRFESIQRGVVDLRDLIYYLSLTGIFLALNVLSLDSKRWSTGEETESYRQSFQLTTSLVVINLLLLNIWLFPLSGARLDLTEQGEYSLSPITRELLQGVQEPLLIRGYFSEQTHPLLAPLAPRVKDMLEEYRIASNGNVMVEIVDPATDEEKETEANQTYGIQPTPLQAADRHSASLVNAYFDILIRYGDQNEVLGFQDLIETQPTAGGGIEVGLRNLEYDLTRAVKKAVYGFQSIGAVLAQMEEPASLTLYYTPDSLPAVIADAPNTIQSVAQDIESKSNGKFTFTLVNVDDPNSSVTRQTMLDQFGLRPIAVDLFATTTYYLHQVLIIGDEAQLLAPAGDLSEADVRTTIESALKRSTSGFLKVVGIWTPPDAPSTDPFGQQVPSVKQYTTIGQQLREDYTVRPVDLSTGQVPVGIDVLVVIAPQGMTDLDHYAIDQYLMRGGSVIMSAGNYGIAPDPFTGGITLEPLAGTVREMLLHYGIEVQETLVLDPQSEPFIQVEAGSGFGQPQIEVVDPYPYFVDIRQEGMSQENPILSQLPAVTLNWVSPVVANEEQNAERQVDVLLESTPNSWLRSDTDIQANYLLNPDFGFPVEGEPTSHPLAISVQGTFESFFQGKEIPTPPEEGGGAAPAEVPDLSSFGTIEASPDTARLVVIGSAEFLNDVIFNISSQLSQGRYLNSLQFMQNIVDWSVEDLDLLTIRSRGTSVRVLYPLTEDGQRFWEYVNYIAALVSLAVIGGVWYYRGRNEQPMDLLPPDKLSFKPAFATASGQVTSNNTKDEEDEHDEK